MPLPAHFQPGMTADQFTAAGNPALAQTQTRDSRGALARIADARRDIARIRFDMSAGYHGPNSPRAQAALERLRAIDSGPGSETQAPSHDEMMNQLRRVDPSGRRAGPDNALSSALAGGLRKAGKSAAEFSASPSTEGGAEWALEQLRQADPASRRGPDHGPLERALAAELRKRGLG